ncbi:MAG: putative Histidine kinase [Promethearchaeota archaeon]|nr:MAG: putative Histidine kinase [Candidatus Lokiarchaeota archaeon]
MKDVNYNDLFERSPLSIIIFNNDGEIIDCNAATGRLFGYEKSELMGENYAKLNILNKSQIDTLITIIRDSEKEISNPLEFKAIKKDGESVFLNIHLSEVNIKNEKGYQAIIKDISDRKRIENELAKERDILRNIIELNPYAIEIKDTEGYHVAANKAFADLWGDFPPEDNSVFTDQHTEEEKKQFLDAVNGSIVKDVESCYNPRIESETAFDKDIWINCVFFPIFDQDEEVENVVVMYEDITERKEAELALKESRRELRELNKKLEEKVKERTLSLEKSQEKYKKAFHRINFYKDLFTHDISNIFQTIAASVELSEIYDKDDVQRQAEISQIIRNQIARGKKLILNVQKLSKIENDGLTFQKISVKENLANAVQFIEESFQNKRISIKINNHKNYFVRANELILDIFENILLNAIRHNINDEIEIIINYFPTETKQLEYIRFEFIDNGIGVENSRKQEIFERKNNSDQNGKGMGLGLSLVSKIINLYGGNICVEDRVPNDHSKGSKFIFFIPKF